MHNESRFITPFNEDELWAKCSSTDVELRLSRSFELGAVSSFRLSQLISL